MGVELLGSPVVPFTVPLFFVVLQPTPEKGAYQGCGSWGFSAPKTREGSCNRCASGGGCLRLAPVARNTRCKV